MNPTVVVDGPRNPESDYGGRISKVVNNLRVRKNSLGVCSRVNGKEIHPFDKVRIQTSTSRKTDLMGKEEESD